MENRDVAGAVWGVVGVGVSFCEIALVADEDAHFGAGAVGVELADPLGDFVEGIALGEVENEEAGVDVFEVGARDAGELLLAGSVPGEHLERLAEVVDLQFSPDEVDADRRLGGGLEAAVFEAHEQRGLAHLGFADQNALHGPQLPGRRRGVQVVAVDHFLFLMSPSFVKLRIYDFNVAIARPAAPHVSRALQARRGRAQALHRRPDGVPLLPS